MRVAILASGSRGDVQPYVALGKGLQDAGHDVRLISAKNYERLAKSAGVPFHSTRGDVQAVAESAEMRALIEKGDFIAITRFQAQALKSAWPCHWRKTRSPAVRAWSCWSPAWAAFSAAWRLPKS